MAAILPNCERMRSPRTAMFVMIPPAMEAVEAAVLSEEARGATPGRGRQEGRRVLVVGGGQQDHGLQVPPVGNGGGMAVLFAREGASVAVADVDGASAEATAELARAEGARWRWWSP